MDPSWYKLNWKQLNLGQIHIKIINPLLPKRLEYGLPTRYLSYVYHTVNTVCAGQTAANKTDRVPNLIELTSHLVNNY